MLGCRLRGKTGVGGWGWGDWGGGLGGGGGGGGGGLWGGVVGGLVGLGQSRRRTVRAKGKKALDSSPSV